MLPVLPTNSGDDFSSIQCQFAHCFLQEVFSDCHEDLVQQKGMPHEGKGGLANYSCNSCSFSAPGWELQS
jgi:hypothetical protein